MVFCLVTRVFRVKVHIITILVRESEMPDSRFQMEIEKHRQQVVQHLLFENIIRMWTVSNSSCLYSRHDADCPAFGIQTSPASDSSTSPVDLGGMPWKGRFDMSGAGPGQREWGLNVGLRIVSLVNGIKKDRHGITDDRIPLIGKSHSGPGVC
jgi:hypothetical protein